MPTLNADSGELDRFNALARSWWDPDGPMGPLHAIGPLRLDYIQRTESLHGQRVADIGCGGGLMAEAMTRAGARVTAVDLSEELLGAAIQHADSEGLAIDYRVASAESLAEQEAGAFDRVTCLEMLEHVPDPDAVVAACAQLLKPGGEVVFSTIHRNPKAFGLAIVGAEYVLGMLPRGTHEYAKFIRPSELARTCRETGLTVTDMTGLTYNPLTRTYRLNDADVDVNYFLRAVRHA